MKKIFIGLFASVLLLSACKELIEIEMPNAKPILVVEGEVTTEMDSSFVRLTLSTNYYQSEAVPIVQTANGYALAPLLKKETVQINITPQ
jgi:hypothetical protein